jgi:hypothetical protein
VNRRRALRLLGTLAVAAAGAAVVSASRSEEASAYVLSEPSTDFNGPIRATGSNNVTPDGASVIGVNTAGTGVAVYGTVTGGSGSSYGVYGLCNAAGGIGVYGEGSVGLQALGSDIGAFSSGTNFGVQATTGAGTGVYGISGTGNGVYGANNTPSGGQAAILGGNSGGGPAVEGFSGTGVGVAGGTASGIGFGGIATTTGTGVAGQANNGPAVQGVTTAGGTGLAGDFRGNVSITGTLTIMGIKSAAVRGSSGSLVRLYCVESPEAWFEDFGHGQLTNGGATVQLEPGFASVVKTDDYHVYLTPRGVPKGPLYIDNAGPSGFTVHDAGGASTIAFDYRIVAKRKDIPGVRLEHVEEPPAVQLLKLPELPATLPTPPTLPVPIPPGHGG